MKLQKGKNCLSTSFAMCCGVSEDDFTSHLPARGNWHYQECMVVAFQHYGKMCMPLYKTTELGPPFNSITELDFNIFRHYTMVLITDTHAVACESCKIYDPKGFVKSLTEINNYQIAIIVTDF